jgi:hypothetical protein
MYGIPKELDLSAVINEFTTQLRVGQFDLQFTCGKVNFVIQSPVNLYRNGNLFAHWEEGKWPDPGFYEIMNTEIIAWKIENEKLIVLEFKSGIEMHLIDHSSQYESMQISIEGVSLQWVI